MQVRLYTKPDCHLCDIVKADLRDLQTEIGFLLEEINILDDPNLTQQLQYVIPVVDMDHGPALYAPIDFLALHNALVAAKRIELAAPQAPGGDHE